MSKIEELKTATELVKETLERYPETRNSDDQLYLLVCRAINIDILRLPFGLVMRQRKKYNLPAFESVRRTRQKIQAAHPELCACADVEAMREVNEEAFREYARKAQI